MRDFCRNTILILLFLTYSISAIGQDGPIKLKASDLSKNGSIWLSSKEGWLYKAGSDESLSIEEIKPGEWQPCKPTEVSSEQEDENGRIEGWFRLSVVLEGDLSSLVDHITVANFGQALDVYVNGNYITSFGNSGLKGGDFARSEANFTAIQYQFKPNEELNIAVHYVSEPLSAPLHQLAGPDALDFDVGIITNQYIHNRKERNKTVVYSFFFTTIVCFVLACLFLIISLQNPKDKTLRLITLSSFMFFMTMFMNVILVSTYTDFYLIKTSYATFTLINRFLGIAVSVMIYSIILVFSQVFTGANPKRHWLIIALIVLLALGFTVIQQPLFEGAILFIILGICLAYVTNSWKAATKSQWAIIFGFIMTLVSLISYFIYFLLIKGDDSLLANLIFLWFPVSLLFYVSLRFKETFEEVKSHSDKILSLKEEQRKQAIDQQKILEEQVAERTKELKTSIESLKSTQSQLIHSEKMASLGELTAGIAHEIQNPLNFVNNFSDLNKELIDEQLEELEKGDIDEAKSIAMDIKANEEKVTYHGKRAEHIVKSMLQHSRTGSGEKELTDINALCDEYLRLSYHGYRAKDKSFQSDFKLDLFPDLPKANVVPQDIGRVLLNLINNAFQAVQAVEKPEVIVSTQLSNGLIQISVSDNGPGIPDDIKDKIFQPFFTTKPTGEGTGLGLSMSYDIVTKGHGGSIDVQSIEGKGTTFNIQIPLT